MRLGIKFYGLVDILFGHLARVALIKIFTPNVNLTQVFIYLFGCVCAINHQVFRCLLVVSINNFKQSDCTEEIWRIYCVVPSVHLIKFFGWIADILLLMIFDTRGNSMTVAGKFSVNRRFTQLWTMYIYTRGLLCLCEWHQSNCKCPIAFAWESKFRI